MHIYKNAIHSVIRAGWFFLLLTLVSGAIAAPTVLPLDLSRAPARDELIAAGQFGGPLTPVDDKQATSDELTRHSFGEAIQAWNAHDYNKAADLFKAHIEQFPHSPWVSEAELHLGCDSRYQGRYTEAEQQYQSILERHSPDNAASRKMLNKATLRLGVLETLQNNHGKAAAYFKDLHKNGLDWRERTYASYWIQQLSRYQANKSSLLNCGVQALGYLLEQQGKTAEAEAVRQIQPSSEQGHSVDELINIAKDYGYALNGVRVNAAELDQVNLPAILQISGNESGDSGHYWILEKIHQGLLFLYDPQSQRRFEQTKEELQQQWSGVVLLFSEGDAKNLPGSLLTHEEMVTLTGGCCGVPRLPDDLGAPDDEQGCGAPVWSVNKVNMNLYVQDTPLWYDAGKGPSVQISLSYNSLSSQAYYEPFGNKWQFNYASYLVVDTVDVVTIFMPDGRRDVYSPDGNDGYQAPVGVYNTLNKLADNHYQLEFLDGTIYEYNIPEGTQSQQPFLVTLYDNDANSLQFGYDANARLTSITDTLNRVTTISYNADDLISQVTDPFGRSALFSYDANSNLIGITDMGGITSTLSYDDDVYITSIDYGQGPWQFYIEPSDGIMGAVDYYPEHGAPMWDNYRITIVSPQGDKEEYFYDGYNQKAWYVAPEQYVDYGSSTNNGQSSVKKTLYYYTTVAGKGKISQISYPDGGSVTYSYDSAGNRTAITRSGQGTYNLTYDSFGNVTSITDPNGNVETYVYSADGRDLLEIQNDLGTVVNTYDANHHLLSVQDILNNLISFTYNADDLLATTTYPNNVVEEYLYNAQKRLAQTKLDSQIKGTYTYDSVGRVQSYTGPDGVQLTFQYDNLNRLSSITYPDGKSLSNNWSAISPWLLDSVTGRDGKTTQFAYDAEQQLTAETGPDLTRTRFEYDANGNLIKLIDANGNATSFEYDANNRLIKKTYADGKFVTYTYNSADQLATRTNARGITTSYGYDNKGNLTSVTYSDGTPSVSFSYDAYDRVISRTDAVGTTSYQYDANSNVLSVDGPWDNDSLQMTYDALDRRASLTVPDGYTLNYGYDTQNRLSQLQFAGKTVAFGYQGAGVVPRTVTRQGTITTDYTYDTLLRNTAVTHKNGGTDINSFSYTYNAQDQRDSETVTQGDVPGPTQDNEISSEYNNLNQLLASTNPARAYEYDDDGNLIQGYTKDGYQFTAGYDAENRLITLNYNDGTQDHRVEYTYGADSFVRVIKKYVDEVLTEETRLVRDGYLIVQERDGSNTPLRSYVWSSDALGGIGALTAMVQDSQVYYYLFDGRGNVASVVDDSANVVAGYVYDAFGELKTVTGSLEQPFRFSTKYYDGGTGLVDFGYRFYVAEIGRWLNRDPLDTKGGVNLFTYVGNNPLNYVDPYGLWTIQIGFSGSGGAAAGGTAGAGIVFGYSRENGFQFGTYEVVGGGGYGGVGASGVIDLTWSPNTDICDLRGIAGTVGGSVGSPISVGGEVNIPQGDASPSYTISGGFGVGPTPFEIHGFITNTFIQEW
jgi:RHS repeat-associated protein